MNKKVEILVVDDDPDIQDSLRIILESNQYAVRTAANGREAMGALEDHLPDLMILDVMMATDTEGFDLAYKLRENTRIQEPAHRDADRFSRQGSRGRDRVSSNTSWASSGRPTGCSRNPWTARSSWQRSKES